MEDEYEVPETLMLKRIEGAISDEESSVLDALLEESEEHRAAYEELEKLWKVTAPGEEKPSDLDYEKAWASVRQRMTDVSSPDKPALTLVKPFYTRRLVWVAAAAAIALLIWTGLPTSNDLLEIVTGFGETENIVLADGSTVRLNAGSTLRFPPAFEGDDRTVNLDGEAFFDIESNGKPFIVQSGASEVQVLGTEFNVRTRDGVTRVAVREGRVRLQPAGASEDGLELSANQAGSLSPSGSLALDERGVEEGLDWLVGELIFSGATLQEVAEEFERSLGIEIELASEIEASAISGTFAIANTDIALEALCLSAGCTVQFDDGVYHLRSQ